jgi:hypothetical protein
MCVCVCMYVYIYIYIYIYVCMYRRESHESDVWGRLEFGDDSSVDLSVEPDTPFIIGMYPPPHIHT